MLVERLRLVNFRNYARLDVALPAGIVILYGPNAQGKTNFLEAVYLLATTKSFRATADRELIHWLAFSQDFPVTRVTAQVIRKTAGPLVLEIIIAPQSGYEAAGGTVKRIKISGVAKRAVDLVGQLRVVLFTPADIDLVAGSPQARRRYLDITNSQVDPRYLRTLQVYNRVVAQRNALLRQVRDRRASAESLAVWEDPLVEAGAYIILRRARTVSALNDLVRLIHPKLTGRQEHLRVEYVPELGGLAKPPELPQNEAELAELLRRALRRVGAREVALGMSLVGPHRDDLKFYINGADINLYGSRGQQRTAALSLKLAEAEFMRAETGEWPVLLLDDILSELDAERRRHVLGGLLEADQMFITATDLADFPPEFLARAARFRVEAGQLTREA